MAAALALLSSVLWGTADFLGGTATRRLPVLTVLRASQLVALVGLVPVAIVTGELGAERGYVLPGIAAGVIGMVALGSFYRALALGTMGIVAPIAALGVVVPITVGLARGEAPTALQGAGMVVAIVGVVLASGQELRGEPTGVGARPMLLAAVAAAGFGCVLLLVAEGSDAGGSAVMMLLTMRCASVVVLGVLGLARPAEASVRGDVPLLVVIGVCDVAANGAFAVASQSELVSITAVLASLYPVVTALLARQVHHERLTPIQLAGVGGALLGVALLASG
jgi:drug/metabolite transporter (DMT)-like permease